MELIVAVLRSGGEVSQIALPAGAERGEAVEDWQGWLRICRRRGWTSQSGEADEQCIPITSAAHWIENV